MNEPRMYISKPTTIKAIQWTGDNAHAVQAFTGEHRHEIDGTHAVFTIQNGFGELYVAANGAWLPLQVGEWVAEDSVGFYPIKDEIFRKKYAETEDF